MPPLLSLRFGILKNTFAAWPKAALALCSGMVPCLVIVDGGSSAAWNLSCVMD